LFLVLSLTLSESGEFKMEGIDKTIIVENEVSPPPKNINVKRLPMNQLEFHERFQLVPKRDTLKLVASHLHLKKEVR
jgi:hypothetical protein